MDSQFSPISMHATAPCLGWGSGSRSACCGCEYAAAADAKCSQLRDIRKMSTCTRVHYILFIPYFIHHSSFLLCCSGAIKYTSTFGFWRKPKITLVENLTQVSRISRIDVKSSMSQSSFDTEELDKQTVVKFKKLYSFQEARRLARGHGFSSKEEFLLYDCPGAYQLPKNPNEIYQEEGWVDWEDFLGIPYPSYEEAKLVVQKDILPKNLLFTKDEYLTFMEELSRRRKVCEAGAEERESRIGRLPYRPDIYYQNSWLGWEDYLNIEQEPTSVDTMS